MQAGSNSAAIRRCQKSILQLVWVYIQTFDFSKIMKKQNSNDLLNNLKNAIKNLEAFANQNESELIPNIQELDLKENNLVPSPHSTLKKTIDLIASVLPDIKHKHEEKRTKIKKRLLESVEFLRNHYQIIHNLKNGTSEQKELAAWAIATISRYNQLINKVEMSSSLKNRVVHYFYEKSGLGLKQDLKYQKIHLPHEFSVHFTTAKDQKTAPQGEKTKEKIASFFKQHDIAPHQLTEQEKEMFLMKTIILARSLKLPPNLTHEFASKTGQVPIETEVSLSENQEDNTSIVSLEKTITLLPWEVTKVKGAFKRDAKSKVPSEPIKESFEASTTATQTAFPHPSQHTGFALSNTLIPESLHLLDTTPLFRNIYERKKLIAQALLPEGELNEKAKIIWNLKHKAFDGKKEYYLNLHRQMILALVKDCSHLSLDIHLVFTIIDRYFRTIAAKSATFELLSQTYYLINVFFIEYPYEYLAQEWLKLPRENLPSPKVRYQQAEFFLNNRIHESVNELTEEIENSESSLAKTIEEYILHVGYLIGQGCKSILQQKNSEKMGFAPPMFSEFEHKLQISAFRQMLSFHEELLLDFSTDKKKLLETLHQRLSQELLFEIQLFENAEMPQDQSTEITLELERYFNERFFRHN